jgi:predicted HTH domain antitoxin
MTNTTLEVQVPAPLLRLGISREEISHRITEWLVFSLFVEGRISSGKAGQLLGISRIEFLALLRKHGIAYVDYTEDELADEWQAVADLPVTRKE